MSPKSPFFVMQEFASPLLCEEILDIVDFTVPNTDKNGFEVKTIKTSERAEQLLYERVLSLMPTIQSYYDLKHKGTEQMEFEWYPEGSKGEFTCENSKYLRGKWLRTQARDLTAIVFLSDYQDQLPFEDDYEVYGGKLEFVQWNFGFNPMRGTLVVFPSDPHFINITTPILAGDLFQVRFHIAATLPYLFDPTKFPGDYTTWFSNQIDQQ